MKLSPIYRDLQILMDETLQYNVHWCGNRKLNARAHLLHGPYYPMA